MAQKSRRSEFARCHASISRGSIRSDQHIKSERRVSFLTAFSHGLLTKSRYEYSIKKEDNEDDEELEILVSSDEEEDEDIDEEFLQEVNDEDTDDEEEEESE